MEALTDTVPLLSPHVVDVALTVVVGKGLTVTVTVVVFEQPLALVPVTTYVDVTVGFAVTVDPEVVFNPVDGDHVYVDAPLAVNVVLVPLHIAEGVGAETVGSGNTVTTAVLVFVHPLAFVPVIVYVDVAVGFAVTLAPVVALNPVAGDHV